MDIRSIVVDVGFDVSGSHALGYAIDLAKSCGAELIGVAAEEPVLAFSAVDAGAVAMDAYTIQRDEIEHGLARAGEQFEAALPSGVKGRWSPGIALESTWMLKLAAEADLIVTPSKTQTAFRLPHIVKIGELIVMSGRPVIAVADEATTAKFDKILIAWKDTREARRAVADALPFLARASEIVAVTIGEGDDPAGERHGLDQLAAWLRRHNLAARTEVIDNPDRFTDVLERSGFSNGADLVVAGGYGHGRMREWLFGGMTRNLLEANSLNRLLSN